MDHQDTVNEDVVSQLCSTRTMDELFALREQLHHGCVQPNPWFKSLSLAEVDMAISLHGKEWFVKCRKTTFESEVRDLSVVPLARLKRWRRQIKAGRLPQKHKDYLEGDYQWNILALIDAVIARYGCEEFQELRRQEECRRILSWLPVEELKRRLDDIEAARPVSWPEGFDPAGVSAESIRCAIEYETEELARAELPSEYRISTLCFCCSMEELLKRKKGLEDGNGPKGGGDIDSATLEEVDIAIETYDSEENRIARQAYADCFGHMPYV